MTLTLWRGTDLLGTVHERSMPQAVAEDGNGRRHVNAVLVPNPAFLPLPSVNQYVRQWAGSEVVSEDVREPHVTRLNRRAGAPSGGKLGVWPVSSDPGSRPSSLPAERQLVLRDDSGRVVRTRSIGVLEHRPHPEHLPTELSTLPEGAFIGGSVWLVHFTEETTAPTT
jgi:hypothetical protein